MARDKRYAILMQVARLPAELELPVVFGHLRKSEYREDEAVRLVLAAEPARKGEAVAKRNSAHIVDIAEHMVAFARAQIAIERQMHRYSRDEICMLFAEDTDRVKRALRVAHAIMRDSPQIKGTEFESVPELPLRKIVDTPHFANKTDLVPLQLADMCAWLILRASYEEDRNAGVLRGFGSSAFLAGRGFRRANGLRTDWWWTTVLKATGRGSQHNHDRRRLDPCFIWDAQRIDEQADHAVVATSVSSPFRFASVPRPLQAATGVRLPRRKTVGGVSLMMDDEKGPTW